MEIHTELTHSQLEQLYNKLKVVIEGTKAKSLVLESYKNLPPVSKIKCSNADHKQYF
jgi:hypothetical protein